MNDYVTKLHGDRAPVRVAIVTSIHPDFDARIWKHALLLASSGVQVDLICPWDVPNLSVQNGITFHPFKKVTSRGLRPFLIPLRVIPRLLKIIRDVDIVHFHDIDLLPMMALLSLGKTVVYDVHENYAEEMLVRDWIPRYLRRPLAFFVKWGQFIFSSVIRNIVLVAPSQEHAFSAKYFRKIYLYNYASLALLDGVAGNYLQRDDIVVFIGSQHLNNGSLLLLDIVEETIKRVPSIRFRSTDRFSNPKFKEYFLSEVSRRGLGKHIELMPNVKPHELMKVLNEATIGISPNLRVAQQINGIHTKVFEYMAAGIPMVISDLPHQVGVIQESGGCILAAPENPTEFAVAIEKLTKDKRLAQEMGLQGQKGFREHHSYESQQQHLLSYYRQILN